MYIEFAPMEGITTYLFRAAFHRHFTPADRYFTPFIAPNMNKGLNTRERRDVLPEHNRGMEVIPQILTNRADYFLFTCRDLAELGYSEVNLNLGCPSGTVAAKNKGAGFLSQTEDLKQFLDEIFSRSPLKISIKTRVGRYDEAEWPGLVALLRQYPCTELILHPRIQKDFYQGEPRMGCVDLAVKEFSCPLVYNGNLFAPPDFDRLSARYPGLDRVMVGRGLICNPWLLGGEPDLRTLRDFHDELFEGYRAILYGDGPVLCKMKGVWAYLIQSFTNHRPYQKVIRKTRSLSEYQSTVNALFHNEAWVPNTRYTPEK